jgi:hypothetical protein
MIGEILEQVRRQERVRCTLSGGGVLQIDRGLPFLIVYRQPPDREDGGTERLVSGEASYLVARPGEEDEASELIRRLAKHGSTAYGAFLVLEVWSATDENGRRFTVHAPPEGPAPETIGKLADALEPLRRLRPGIEVEVERGDARHPPGLPSLLSIEESWQSEVLLLGLEVPPVYRDADGCRLPALPPRRAARPLSRAAPGAVRVRARADLLARWRTTWRSAPARSRRRSGTSTARWSRSSALRPAPAHLAGELRPGAGALRARRPRAQPRVPLPPAPHRPRPAEARLFAIEMETIDDPAVADLFRRQARRSWTRCSPCSESGAPPPSGTAATACTAPSTTRCSARRGAADARWCAPDADGRVGGRARASAMPHCGAGVLRASSTRRWPPRSRSAATWWG